jgi:hypothetical protein
MPSHYQVGCFRSTRFPAASLQCRPVKQADQTRALFYNDNPSQRTLLLHCFTAVCIAVLSARPVNEKPAPSFRTARA